MAATETLKDATTTTTPRRPRSARRTSHVDIVSLDDGGLDLSARARDLLTHDGGHADVLAEASARALVSPTRQLTSLETSPSAAATTDLLGRPVGAGFRAALDAALPHERDAQTPLYLLIDELPVAAVISGYAALYTRPMQFPTAPEGGSPASGPIARRPGMGDQCAGWRSDGTMMTSIAREGRIPIPVGPPAPVLEPDDDELAWHATGDLARGAMRRRRLVDVTWGDPLVVAAMFRDTYVDSEGLETVLHEYTVDLTVDPGRLVVLESVATPRVLPWIECPAAADSARRLVGHDIGDARQLVRQDFKGITTCTHLNDLLRSLADVTVMAERLRRL